MVSRDAQRSARRRASADASYYAIVAGAAVVLGFALPGPWDVLADASPSLWILIGLALLVELRVSWVNRSGGCARIPSVEWLRTRAIQPVGRSP